MFVTKVALLFTLYSQAQAGTEPQLPIVEEPPVQHQGVASWYGDGRFHGATTANGEAFNPQAYTCAHRYLPFDTVVLVENQRNHKRVWCRINDRGPYGLVNHEGSWSISLRRNHESDRWRGILDMSVAAADAIDLRETGIARVHILYWTRQISQTFDLALLQP